MGASEGADVEHISIHALLAESDRMARRRRLKRYLFLSTLSLRRATENALRQIVDRRISIHALLAESDLKRCQALDISVISIHALLAESDLGRVEVV